MKTILGAMNKYTLFIYLWSLVQYCGINGICYGMKRPGKFCDYSGFRWWGLPAGRRTKSAAVFALALLGFSTECFRRSSSTRASREWTRSTNIFCFLNFTILLATPFRSISISMAGYFSRGPQILFAFCLVRSLLFVGSTSGRLHGEPFFDCQG